MPMRSWHCAANMRMRKVKWATDYLPTASCLVKEPSKQAGNWKKLLDTDTLHIEIGCGKGNYSLDMAKMYPDTGFIAIEKNESAAGIAAKKYDEDTEKKRLKLIQEDASSIGEWFGPREVDVIHLNFSDPWPKARHAKRRLTSREFLARYSQILPDGAVVEFKTDNKGLFEFSLEEVNESEGWELLAHTFDLHHQEDMMEGNVMTEYEEKFSSMGNPICKLIAVLHE